LVTEQSTVKEIEKKFRDQEEDLLDKLWTFLDIKSIVENEIKAIDRMLRRLDMVRRDAREAMTKRIQTARLAVREGINETV
jgi:BMFP domain-containing protein YqiC